MGNESSEYLPLVSSSSETTPSLDEIVRPYKRRERIFSFFLVLQTIALVVVVFYYKPQSHQPEENATGYPQNDRSLLYSPAQVALQHEVKSFTPGHEHKTRWQGAGDDVDRAWGELYNHTIMMIPHDEAARLPNKTYPIAEHPGYYIAELDVFHQLHCLNVVRRALHRDHYISAKDLDEDHVSHCVDSIRQSLMCSADISVNVWQWRESYNAVVGFSTQAHSCRNFDKLREWALDRRIRQFINTTRYVEDGLPEPPVYR